MMSQVNEFIQNIIFTRKISIYMYKMNKFLYIKICFQSFGVWEGSGWWHITITFINSSPY